MDIDRISRQITLFAATTLIAVGVATAQPISTSEATDAVEAGLSSPFLEAYPPIECVQPGLPTGELTRDILLQLELDVRAYRACISDYILVARQDIQNLTNQTNGIISGYNQFILDLTKQLNLDLVR